MSVLCARCSACLIHVYIDMKACVRIAVPCCDTCAMPLSLRPRCMPCRACRCMSLCLKRIELAMLNIFIMTVQFHADRWDGCACMPCPHSTAIGTPAQSEVGLETGGQGRAGGRTAQMTTRGLSDGHAGHLSRDDLSSTRRRSLGRKLSFSAHDFFGYLLRACMHNPTLANVDSKKASLGVVSGRHGDCATWSFRA